MSENLFGLDTQEKAAAALELMRAREAADKLATAKLLEESLARKTALTLQHPAEIEIKK